MLHKVFYVPLSLIAATADRAIGSDAANMAVISLFATSFIK